MFNRSAWVVLVVLAAGCGAADRGGKGGEAVALTPSADGKKYLLDSEPAGAKGVIEVRKDARDGEDVIVVGRVGGTEKPFTEGRALFLIVDPSLKPATECDCPWDYCESPKQELIAARVSVKFVDDSGKTLPAGARELFGIKELTTVVVKGKASRDERNNVSIVASNLYVRPEKQ